jgi:ribosomal protein S18 acetylase RimI-like enzyme
VPAPTKDLGSMTEPLIRRARMSDIPAIIGLLADDPLGRHREDTSSPPNPRYVAAFRAIDVDPNQLLAVMTLHDDVVGCLQITFIPGLGRTGAWRGQIEAVRIAAAQRGARLGQQMLEWAIAECRARDCLFVQLTTDKSRSDAHRFYERLGFVGTHLGYKLALKPTSEGV